MVDVCLIAEGSYPYVTGGVSTWTNDLIKGLPDLDFAVVQVGHGADDERRAYERPANLLEATELDIDPDLDGVPRIDDALPQARVYHSLSTGLAGAIGAQAADSSGAPLVLTEHGLAWLEARLGISGCKPKRRPIERRPGERRGEAVARHAAATAELARQAYARAHTITTVCRSNARLQQRQGAPVERLRVIENAVAPASAGSPADTERKAPRVALVGRVVPVKDVETFVRSARLVADELPRAEFVVVGPLDHDRAYVERCGELVKTLGLAERLTFAGERDKTSLYEHLDVVVLTSRSEAQPLVLLEAMAAGVPAVATAVGGCHELLRGGSARPAGIVTPVRDPQATADAVLAICLDEGLRARLADGGRERARRQHSPALLLSAYREVYERALEPLSRAA